ncbi:hypothetical protein DICPUDRAFT_42068 [Dictyostelium purpureum]|uniref:Uncharacterized protein n=1 Tax=Dictyostelium purpureum TaxID=5786 RepID=F1A1C0_DICPU|nr:uncharacterized protein DICPUDRAFT_42068 [Dictyostelium purpureum]EGC30013.1 hypothetical protein DICPUDRAFT_42068 [Dictyostelium purpureum]|eukprot:XP_003293459.1 hypothetical protein DICPUDRAFT_42068 [Dictyostelium purpureum]
MYIFKFIFFVIFIIIFYKKVFEKYNFYNDISNSNNNNNNYNDNKNSVDFKKKDFPVLSRGYEKIDYLVLNSQYTTKSQGRRDILYSSQNASERFFIGSNSFSRAVAFNNINYSPQNIWSVALLGLQKIVNVSRLVSTKNWSAPIILKNSTLFNISALEAESVLTKEISSYIDSSFSSLISPNFSTPNTKDNLIFFVNIMGSVFKMHDYYRGSPKRGYNLDLIASEKSITLLGKTQDYESMKSQIKSIYEKLSQILESNTDIPHDEKYLEIIRLYDWYEKNSYYLELFIRNLSTKSYKLNIAVFDFDESNTNYGFSGLSRGYSYLPAKVIDENNNNIYPNERTKIFGGHFGADLIHLKDMEPEEPYKNSIALPQIDWVLTNYYPDIKKTKIKGKNQFT